MFHLTSQVTDLAARAGYHLDPSDLPAATITDPLAVAALLGATAGTAVIGVLRELVADAAAHTRTTITDLADSPSDQPRLHQAATYLAWLTSKADTELDRRSRDYRTMLAENLHTLATHGAVRSAPPPQSPEAPQAAQDSTVAAQLRTLAETCAADWGWRLDWTALTATLGPRLNEIHDLLDAVAGLCAAHLYRQLLTDAIPAARSDLSTADTEHVGSAAAHLATLTEALADCLHTQATHNHTVITTSAALAKRARAWRRERWIPTPPQRTAAAHTA
ncbi:MAG: hypothetical protein ACRDT6_25660 [Micromonosporaceae bacterium]